MRKGEKKWREVVGMAEGDVGKTNTRVCTQTGARVARVHGTRDVTWPPRVPDASNENT